MHVLKGHYRNDDGTLTRGTLLVERVGDQILTAYHEPLHAAQFRVAPGLVGTEITGPDVGWYFEPAAGECERIGMPIARLA